LDALSLLELRSVARGYRVLDALVKESPVRVLEANLIEPGRFLILTGGGVAEVEAAHRVGCEVAADDALDTLFLPYAHRSLWTGLGGVQQLIDVDAIGVIEGSCIAGVLDACDRVLKHTDVALCGLRIATALGGKGYFVVHGAQDAVESAIAIGAEVLTQRGRRVAEELIARPHPDFLSWLLRPAPFTLAGFPLSGGR
jgi:microcompartment protein CcmL/EutN